MVSLELQNKNYIYFDTVLITTLQYKFDLYLDAYL
jgi:hypothetical protein